MLYSQASRAISIGQLHTSPYFQNHGAIEVYVHPHTRQLLGAELFVEEAEHLAHLINWMISGELMIDEILEKPFYHPTLEEGLRTALKHARRQLVP